MKLEQMILCIENDKGREKNYLYNAEDYIRLLEEIYPGMPQDIAGAVESLYETKQSTRWTEEYVTSNKRYYAKFVNNLSELQKFLGGLFNETTSEMKNYFDSGQCREECKEVLKAYGINDKGKALENAFRYDKAKHDFFKGEKIKEFSGREYRVLEKLGQRDLLLLDEKSGTVMLAEGAALYVREPRQEYKSSNCKVSGVKWSKEVCLGDKITEIDFQNVKREYTARNAAHKTLERKGPKL